MRVGLSPLKGHKWCHNFIDTPSGVCHCNQGIEDTSHFLLSCPSHVIQRETLMSSVNEILLKANKNHLESQLQLYLYGDPSLNNFDNKNIILTTIKFTHPPPLLFCFNLNCFCNFICMCVLCYTFFLFIRVVVCNFLGWTWLWLNSFATPRPCNYSLERKSIYKKNVSTYVFQVKKCTSSECMFCTSHPIRMDLETFNTLKFLPFPMLNGTKEHYRSFDESYITETTEADRPSLNLKLATTKENVKFKSVV